MLGGRGRNVAGRRITGRSVTTRGIATEGMRVVVKGFGREGAVSPGDELQRKIVVTQNCKGRGAHRGTRNCRIRHTRRGEKVLGGGRGPKLSISCCCLPASCPRTSVSLRRVRPSDASTSTLSRLPLILTWDSSSRRVQLLAELLSLSVSPISPLGLSACVFQLFVCLEHVLFFDAVGFDLKGEEIIDDNNDSNKC
ncbi:hypothetical protein Ahy_A08g037933 isoform B [Arachis hypogaea]|uniref:Uncharacterized protein n=1 Tax=Arachis hypogaea TaxID=3818 RepID=A0A445BS67_ARAHY|nr:hypothetical protein Ahy_A08g037933 isoform B [Arachis hypogaea]